MSLMARIWDSCRACASDKRSTYNALKLSGVLRRELDKRFEMLLTVCARAIATTPVDDLLSVLIPFKLRLINIPDRRRLPFRSGDGTWWRLCLEILRTLFAVCIRDSLIRFTARKNVGNFSVIAVKSLCVKYASSAIDSARTSALCGSPVNSEISPKKDPSPKFPRGIVSKVSDWTLMDTRPLLMK